MSGQQTAAGSAPPHHPEPHDQQLREALRAAPVILFAQDRALRYLWIHNPIPELLDKDIVGKFDSELLDDPNEARELIQLKRRVFATGKRQRREMSLQIQGHRASYDIICDPNRNAAGTIDGLICTAIDISEQVRTRQRLVQRHQVLSAVSHVQSASTDLETALDRLVHLIVPDFVDLCVLFLRLPNGKIRRVAAAHRDPYLEEQLVRLQQSDPIDPDGPHPAAQAIRERRMLLNPVITSAVTEATRSAVLEPEQIRALTPRSLVLLPLLLSNQTLGAIGFGFTEYNQGFDESDLDLARELADRAALVIENSRLLSAAQEAVRVRDTFLSIASHELRTPLTALLGQAQLLERRLRANQDLEPRNERSLQIIVTQAIRLNKLVGLLLDVSQLETGQLQIEVAPFDVSALLRQISNELRPNLTQHRLQLQLPDEPVTLVGDALRLEQVFNNLIQNAVKYSPEGGDVLIRLERSADTAVVSISDQGIGIPAGEIPGLFTRFYRAKTGAAQQISGVGIGLFVVQQLVEMHHGTVNVESVEGQGSTFSVTLPLNME
jgi:signal transduction histidine kinase